MEKGYTSEQLFDEGNVVYTVEHVFWSKWWAKRLKETFILACVATVDRKLVILVVI